MPCWQIYMGGEIVAHSGGVKRNVDSWCHLMDEEGTSGSLTCVQESEQTICPGQCLEGPLNGFLGHNGFIFALMISL